MKPRLRLISSRRVFLSGVAAVMPAILWGKPKNSHAARADMRTLVSQLELESLKSERPRRSPGFQCSESEEGALLWTETAGRRNPVCVLNETGRFIWEACDGNHTADEISKGLHDRFLVSRRRVRVDVLSFLWSLKVRGAVQ
ncbi:MAG: PqqD family protein [Thermodesulfobacteriota bacterium]